MTKLFLNPPWSQVQQSRPTGGQGYAFRCWFQMWYQRPCTRTVTLAGQRCIPLTTALLAASASTADGCCRVTVHEFCHGAHWDITTIVWHTGEMTVSILVESWAELLQCWKRSCEQCCSPDTCSQSVYASLILKTVCPLTWCQPTNCREVFCRVFSWNFDMILPIDTKKRLYFYDFWNYVS
jgi:hypothetical protein